MLQLKIYYHYHIIFLVSQSCSTINTSFVCAANIKEYIWRYQWYLISTPTYCMLDTLFVNPFSRTITSWKSFVGLAFLEANLAGDLYLHLLETVDSNSILSFNEENLCFQQDETLSHCGEDKKNRKATSIPRLDIFWFDDLNNQI